MRTEQMLVGSRWIGLAVVVALVVVAALASVATAQTGGDEVRGLPSADMERLSGFTFGELPQVRTSSSEGQAVARSVYGYDEFGATAETYLASLTIDRSIDTDDPIDDLPVWITRLSGFEIEEIGPAGTDGAVGQSHFLHLAYVFVDAETNEFLFAEWQE